MGFHVGEIQAMINDGIVMEGTILQIFIVTRSAIRVVGRVRNHVTISAEGTGNLYGIQDKKNELIIVILDVGLEFFFLKPKKWQQRKL